MRTSAKNKKICPEGHVFYKSSDCPVCPICEKQNRSEAGFLSELSAPARRALQGKEINTLRQLTQFTEKALLALHGMGPSTIVKLRSLLQSEGLTFKQ